MRSQLSFNRRVVYSLAILLLIGQSVSVAAEKFTLSGEVIWPDEEKKKKPKIILKGEKSYDEKISKKGDFKIKRVLDDYNKVLLKSHSKKLLVLYLRRILTCTYLKLLFHHQRVFF